MPDRPDFSPPPTKPAAKFETGAITLHCGDSLQLLQTLKPASVDAIIADPPYCSGATLPAQRAADPISKYCQSGNSLGRPTFTGDTRDQRSFKYWCVLWLSACRAATKEAGYCLVFIDWRQLPSMTDAIQAAGWTWRGVVPWNKGRGSRAPHKGFFRHQCEYILWATNGRVPKLADRGPFEGCFDFGVNRQDKFHITGKPTALLRELVKVAPVGGTILDPFAGSSTSLIAAALENRRAIGFELSDEYFEISRRRIEASLSQARAAA